MNKMANKESDLSEKIQLDEGGTSLILYPKDVKEFIKELKDAYWYIGDCKICKTESLPVNHNSDCVNCVIDKLAGNELI